MPSAGLLFAAFARNATSQRFVCASGRYKQAREAGVTHSTLLCLAASRSRSYHLVPSRPRARACFRILLGKDLGLRGNLKLRPQLQEGQRKRGSWFFSRTVATVSSVRVRIE